MGLDGFILVFIATLLLHPEIAHSALSLSIRSFHFQVPLRVMFTFYPHFLLTPHDFACILPPKVERVWVHGTCAARR